MACTASPESLLYLPSIFSSPEVCVCPGCSLGQCNVQSSSTANHPQLDVVPTLLARLQLQLQLTSAFGEATGSIWCFTNRKVILHSCQHLSTSITRTHANTHRSATRPYPHTHESTDTLRSATHKAVNNRKWYVTEIVSVQLDSASTAPFFHSYFIFCVHVDLSAIFLACLEVFYSI